MNQALMCLLITISFFSHAQNYTSYFTGSNTDIVTNPTGGVCLMGGATEDDNAMKWFLQRANGGDILVLRTSGSNGYNSYFYTGVGVPVNSVETIVCHNASASNEPYVIQKIKQAEAIWFAGGNQWNYINYWINSPVDSAINQAIQQRNIVIGGTSAGMAILGRYYFSAQNGTVTSASALSNPYNPFVTVDSTSFINNKFLANTLTDTHFDNPDRKGRIMAFLARIITDYGVYANAIACDEYTAVCIDTNGIARVFGGHPQYDDNAFFIQPNCELTMRKPENCSAGNPLTWNLGGLAIKAYQIKGDSTGHKTFDLNTWKTGTGGSWYNWAVSNGIFNEQSGTAPNCSILSINKRNNNNLPDVYPNPANDKVTIKMNDLPNSLKVYLYNPLGMKTHLSYVQNEKEYNLDLSGLPSGIYSLMVEVGSHEIYFRNIIKN